MKPNPHNSTHSHRWHLPKFLSHSGQKPSNGARINFIIISLILAFCLIELVLQALTIGRMYPGTSVAGQDISFLSRAEASSQLKDQKLSRTFTIKVGEKTYTATSEDLGAKYDVNTTINTAYNVGHGGGLAALNLMRANENGQTGYAYEVDQAKLKAFADSIVSSVGYSPTNATLKVENGNVAVVPDKNGLRIDQKYLYKVLTTALRDAKDQSIYLEPQNITADIVASETAEAKSQAEQYINRTVTLNFEGKNYTASKVNLGYMVKFQEVAGANGEPTLQASIAGDQVAGWVQSVANQINIAPVNKKINIRNGVSAVEREGKDGRAINQQAAINAVAQGLSANQNVSFALTASPVAFKSETNRSTGLDYGTYIEINLTSQRLWAYQDNNVIFSTPITSGASAYGFGTPTGLFSIYSKQRSRYLNGGQYGWSYNVFVDYWMPFNGGVGLHDADWRSSFGGQDYINGGSHGCVNMPKSSAAFLYGWANVGTPVWVHK